MTPKIFNSETISTTEPSINKSGNKGSTVREREISIPLVLLGFTNMPHLLHQSLITQKQAGDVEENPGPSCHVCERTFTANNTPMSCAACGATAHGSCSGVSRVRRERGWQYICRRCEGDAVEERCLMCRKIFRTNARRVRCECGAEVHASCSGMTRGALGRGTPFKCVQCGGHPVREPEEGLRAEERAGCLVCGVTLRRGASFAVCETCGLKAHKKCTGARRGAVSWRCHQCAPPPARVGPPQSPPSVEEPPARPQEEPPPRNEKCPSCTAKIRRTHDPLICKCCRKQYHIKCAQTTRDALVEQRRQGTWECGMCREERPPRVEPTSDGRTSMKKIERRFGLRMMQWNCDGIATKKDELAELMKREKIHLAMIQETKLGNKDATPNIRGYTAYRKGPIRKRCDQGEGRWSVHIHQRGSTALGKTHPGDGNPRSTDHCGS